MRFGLWSAHLVRQRPPQPGYTLDTVGCQPGYSGYPPATLCPQCPIDLTMAVHAANLQSSFGNPAMWYGLHDPVTFCTAIVMWFELACVRGGRRADVPSPSRPPRCLAHITAVSFPTQSGWMFSRLGGIAEKVCIESTSFLERFGSSSEYRETPKICSPACAARSVSVRVRAAVPCR